MRILTIVHDERAPLGTFRGPLREAGAAVDEWRPGHGEEPPAAPDGYDGVIVLGGRQNPDEDHLYPWLAGEVALLGRLARDGRAVLGICLGGELLARALDGWTGPAPAPERGWRDVRVAPDARADPLLAAAPETVTALEWHGYGFSTPPGAVELARNESGVQAFRFGDRAWGLQFHPEVDEATVRTWAGDAWPGELERRTRAEIARWIEFGRGLAGRFAAAAGA